MGPTNKQGKMQNFLNYRMRAKLKDNTSLAGQMLAFDKHMNLVLADTEEFRKIKQTSKKPVPPGGEPVPEIETEEKRALGLVIIRGTEVSYLTVEGPPPSDPASRLGAATTTAILQPGHGISKPAGRGFATVPPPSLVGPALGIGGPPPGFNPQLQPPGFAASYGPPPGFSGAPGIPPGFPGGPPGFQPSGGRGFPPPPGFGGR